MEVGTVEQLDIITKMREAYLDYAMSVITARALPDVRDGLKPVQRRILYAMADMGLRHDRPYKKSARIVGEVLGKYHPHGDDPVYEAMVRMAQDFSMRYPLVDGQGNFGSVDGDNAAAMRYTEARLTAIAEEMLVDIEKDTVDFANNFDGSLKEPSVLPSRIPNLLLNGASGIAVGMATNIPPHNLVDLCETIAYLIDHYDTFDEISVEDLMVRLPGPDFPTGGIILEREGIKAAYATGKGQIVVRSKVHVEDLKGGRSQIVVTELPYQVNKASLIERIADLVRNHRIETISDLRDESDRQGMRLVIELKRGEDANPTLEELFKQTMMQSTFGVNMLALVDMTPRLLPLKRILQLFIEHRQQVITRRSQFDLERARERAHVLEGLLIALDHLDEVIDTIRRSRTADTAMVNLMKKFKLTEIQARAILDMQLRRLAALERKKIEDEYADVIKQIAYLEDLLANPRKILFMIREEMLELKRIYGDERRTHIVEGEVQELTTGHLVPEERVLVAMTRQGRIGRLAVDGAVTRQRGSIGMAIENGDMAMALMPASTTDTLLFFTNLGQVFQEQVHRLGPLDRQDGGQPIRSIVSLGDSERVTAFLPIAKLQAGGYLTIVTRKGRIKRLSTEELAQIPTVGLTVVGLEEGDEVGWARQTTGNEELILITRKGQAIRFNEEEVRPMGRTAMGVWAIKLEENDGVAGFGRVNEGEELLVITERGYAKRTPLQEYPTQKRYGNGVRTVDISKLSDTGDIVVAQVLGLGDEVILLSTHGSAIRIRAADIPLLRRDTWGTLVRGKQTIMDPRAGEAIASVAVLRGEASTNAASAGPANASHAVSKAPKRSSSVTSRRRTPRASQPNPAASQSAGDATEAAPRRRSTSAVARRSGRKPRTASAQVGSRGVERRETS